MSKSFFKSVEVKIAVFMLTGLFLLVWGINFLQGIDLFKKTYPLYVVFDQTLGLTTSNSVVVNGVSIGMIDRIELMPAANNKVIMRLGIDKKISIPTNSTLTISSSGILSSPHIEVVFGNETSYYQKGDTLYGIITPGLLSAVGNITIKLDNLLANLDTSLNVLKGTLQSGTATDFEITIKELRKSSESLNGILAANRHKINDIVSDVNSFTNTLQDNDEKISEIVEYLNNLSKQLADSEIKKVIDDASQTFAHLDSLILTASEGKGTLGQLLVNDSLYYNLQNSLQSLDNLLIDLQANPTKYVNITVFGKKEKKQKK
ncbi:MAG: MlaD family protein [Lentimicrobiaceae bacterium]|nr:MlaD family protein [Lentimicrobiaceae bacterium]